MFRNVWSVFTSRTSEVGFVYSMWLSISKGLLMYYKSEGCIFVTQNSPSEWVTSSPALPKQEKTLFLLLGLGERNLLYCQTQILHKVLFGSFCLFVFWLFCCFLIFFNELWFAFPAFRFSIPVSITQNLPDPTCVRTTGQLNMYVSMWESVEERILKAFCKPLDVPGCRWMQT